uniref:Ras family protein n=1 Tax=Haemonchus contortus TaxID=6289 RepID=A0A7I4Y4Y5_HAECO
MKFPLRLKSKKEQPTEMTKLTDTDMVRCVIIGDPNSGKEMMLKKYAYYAGVPYDVTNKQVVTAFNDRKCTFVDSQSAYVNDSDDVHVFLLCVSVARQDKVEETVGKILNTVHDRIRGKPFALVGTQIEKRLLTNINNNNSCNIESNSLPMPLHRAERFAKQIGASKYLECSEITGEGLEEVFEEAFQIGNAYVMEKQNKSHRHRKSFLEATGMKKQKSCVTQ